LGLHVKAASDLQSRTKGGNWQGVPYSFEAETRKACEPKLRLWHDNHWQ